MALFQDSAKLLDEIKKGNPDAFEFLFKGYFPRLLGYALRFIPNEEEARDLVQDCFVTFWEKRENLTFVFYNILHEDLVIVGSNVSV